MKINYQEWNALRKAAAEFTDDPQYRTPSIDVCVRKDTISMSVFIFTGSKCHMGADTNYKDSLVKRLRAAITEVRGKAGLDESDGTANG